MDPNELRVIDFLLESLPYCDKEKKVTFCKEALKKFKFGNTVEITSFYPREIADTRKNYSISKEDLYSYSKRVGVCYLRTDGKPTSTTLFDLAKVIVR